LTTNKEAIQSILDEFSSVGTKFEAGCKDNCVEKYISICRSINSRKQVCVVKMWQWWDLDIEGSPSDIFKETGRYPCLIKSDYVFDDLAGRFEPGEWVRSSLLINFSHSCIFETSNTFYLLVGEGTRKTVSLDLVESVF